MQYTDAVAMHRQQLRAKRRSPATLTWYAEQFAAYDEWRIAHCYADDLPSAEQLDAFLADQHDAGLAPSTVHARFRALRALLLFLEKRRRISHDANPIYLIEAPGLPRIARRAVSIEDFDRLLGAIAPRTWLDHRDLLILKILFWCGLRVGELCALLVDDINLDALEILVRSGKGSKARVVPAPAEIRGAFMAYILSRPVHIPQLLLGSDGYGGANGLLRSEGVRQMLIRRCRAAHIEPPYSPHAFRHGFAMWLLNAGARLTTVSTAMGHSDPSITHAIYAHTTTTTVRREYDEARAVLRREDPPNA